MISPVDRRTDSRAPGRRACAGRAASDVRWTARSRSAEQPRGAVRADVRAADVGARAPAGEPAVDRPDAEPGRGRADGRRPHRESGSLPYSGYTSSTHLFLWPFLLGVLDLVGVPMTLATAHVLGGLRYVFVSTTGWFLMMRRIGGLRAALLVLPPATLLLMGYGRLDGSIDFLSMTSESLRWSSSSVAALVLLGSTNPMSTRQLVAGSMVAGLAVWAKPQSGPIAVAFIAACVLITCVERRIGSAARASASTRAATSAIRARGHAGLRDTDPGVRRRHGAGRHSRRRRSVNPSPRCGTTPPTVTRARACRPGSRIGSRTSPGSRFRSPSPPSGHSGPCSIFVCSDGSDRRGCVASGWSAILPPRGALRVCSLWPIHPLFTHYANFLYLGCLLASCIAVRLAVPGQREASAWPPIELACVALSVAVVSAVLVVRIPTRVDRRPPATTPWPLARSTRSRHPCPRTARRAVACSCGAGPRSSTSTYDWTPASRYVNATWQIFPEPPPGRVELDPPRRAPPGSADLHRRGARPLVLLRHRSEQRHQLRRAWGLVAARVLLHRVRCEDRGRQAGDALPPDRQLRSRHVSVGPTESRRPSEGRRQARHPTRPASRRRSSTPWTAAGTAGSGTRTR